MKGDAAAPAGPDALSFPHFFGADDAAEITFSAFPFSILFFSIPRFFPFLAPSVFLLLLILSPTLVDPGVLLCWLFLRGGVVLMGLGYIWWFFFDVFDLLSLLHPLIL